MAKRMLADNLKARKRRKLVLNIAGGLAVGLAGPTAYHAAIAFVTSDPFLGLQAQANKSMAETIEMRMDAVELRDYNGANLVSSAYARRVDVQKNAQVAVLYDVKNGIYNTKEGPIHYSATTANWNFQTKQVVVSNHVTVKNKDLDVSANGLIFDDMSGSLKIIGDVSGTAYKGAIQASMLTYNTKTGAGSAGPVEWKGAVELGAQGEKDDAPKKWDFKCSQLKALGSKSNTYLYENCTASDDELIIKAPLVQNNTKTDVLTASGGVEYYSGKADIKADRCTVYRKEKRAVLTGHVFMYVKPKAQENDPPKIETMPEFKPLTPSQVIATHDTKPLSKDEQKEKEDEIRSSKNLRDFPLVVVSEKTEYWYGKGARHAIITGQPQGRQTLKDNEWRHVWAYSALYDGEKETLTLLSSAKSHDAMMKNSLGEEMTALDILTSTKEDDDEVEGHEVQGHIYSSDEKSTKEDKKTPPSTWKGIGAGGTGSGT
jgi:lipopolysaccharide export system protein LptA